MSRGKPVVASAVGGLTDIVVDGQTGILVPPNDVESLHVALRRLIEDEELRGRRGQAARERLQQEFSAEAVVHTHLPYPWSADWAALSGRLRGKPVVLTYHNDVTGSGWKWLVTGAYNRSLIQLTMSLADRIVVTTPQRESLSPVLRPFTGKLVHIPLGIDSDRFRPLSLPADGRTIGFLSLLRDTHKYKGLDVLLGAMRVLHERGMEVRLKVGGDENLLPYYRSLAQELGVLENVEFAGFLPEDKVTEFYNSMDAFVLPSTDHRFEGFGLVALEALACGRPVVTTTAAGIAPIISENGCGIVVPPRDASALADAIERLLGDADARLEKGQRGRALAEGLSWDRVAEAYERLYEDALSRS